MRFLTCISCRVQIFCHKCKDSNFCVLQYPNEMALRIKIRYLKLNVTTENCYLTAVGARTRGCVCVCVCGRAHAHKYIHDCTSHLALLNLHFVQCPIFQKKQCFKFWTSFHSQVWEWRGTCWAGCDWGSQSQSLYILHLHLHLHTYLQS